MTQAKSNPIHSMLRAMWRNWAIGFGVLVAPMLFSVFISFVWQPFVCLLEIYLLTVIYRRRAEEGIGSASLLVKLARRTILVSAIIMIAINIICTDWFIPTVVTLELYNQEIPFITCLIIFPVMTFFCCWSLYGRKIERHFRMCQRHSGDFAGESLISSLFLRETRYQVYLALVLSVLLGLIEYWYYFSRYINSDLNDPDRFFFTYMPLAIYAVSLLMVRGHYISTEESYTSLEDLSENRKNTTRVRFLILCDDEMLLAPNPETGRWDTPVQSIEPARDVKTPGEVRALFEKLTGLKDFNLRYCYTTTGLVEGASTVHYVVFISARQSVEIKGEHGKWFNTYLLDHAMADGSLSVSTAAELYRIYTITMAWKTYDENGKRLYPIRNYRPTFHLADFESWDVDYDDDKWLYIAGNNEDQRFFRLRAFWDKITGVFIHHD